MHIAVDSASGKALIEFATAEQARKAWSSPRLGVWLIGLKAPQLKGKVRDDQIKVFWYRVDGVGAGEGVGEIEEGEIEGEEAEAEIVDRDNDVVVVNPPPPPKETKKQRKKRLAMEREAKMMIVKSQPAMPFIDTGLTMVVERPTQRPRSPLPSQSELGSHWRPMETKGKETEPFAPSTSNPNARSKAFPITRMEKINVGVDDEDVDMELATPLTSTGFGTSMFVSHSPISLLQEGKHGLPPAQTKARVEKKHRVSSYTDAGRDPSAFMKPSFARPPHLPPKPQLSLPKPAATSVQIPIARPPLSPTQPRPVKPSTVSDLDMRPPPPPPTNTLPPRPATVVVPAVALPVVRRSSSPAMPLHHPAEPFIPAVALPAPIAKPPPLPPATTLPTPTPTPTPPIVVDVDTDVSAPSPVLSPAPIALLNMINDNASDLTSVQVPGLVISTPSHTPPPSEPRAMKNAPKGPSFTKRSLIARHKELEERIRRGKRELEEKMGTRTGDVEVEDTATQAEEGELGEFAEEEGKPQVEDTLRRLVVASQKSRPRTPTPANPLLQSSPPAVRSTIVASASTSALNVDMQTPSSTATLVSDSPLLTAAPPNTTSGSFSLDDLAISFITETISTLKPPAAAPPPRPSSSNNIRSELAVRQRRLELHITESKVLMAQLAGAKSKPEKDRILSVMREKSR